MHQPAPLLVNGIIPKPGAKNARMHVEAELEIKTMWNELFYTKILHDVKCFSNRSNYENTRAEVKHMLQRSSLMQFFDLGKAEITS